MTLDVYSGLFDDDLDSALQSAWTTAVAQNLADFSRTNGQVAAIGGRPQPLTCGNTRPPGRSRTPATGGLEVHCSIQLADRGVSRQFPTRAQVHGVVSLNGPVGQLGSGENQEPAEDEGAPEQLRAVRESPAEHGRGQHSDHRDDVQ